MPERLPPLPEGATTARRPLALCGPLRSPGGRHEHEIPILLPRSDTSPGRDPSNADVHFLLFGEEG
jgi:hypothetical protein